MRTKQQRIELDLAVSAAVHDAYRNWEAGGRSSYFEPAMTVAVVTADVRHVLEAQGVFRRARQLSLVRSSLERSKRLGYLTSSIAPSMFRRHGCCRAYEPARTEGGAR